MRSRYAAPTLANPRNTGAPDRHPPAFAVPPHLQHPSEPFAVWFTEPLGLLTQITRPATGSAAMARFVTELAWPALLELRGASSQPLYVVHDASLLEDVDAEAGRIMTMFGLSTRKQTERVIVVEPPSLPRIAHLAINAVVSAVSLIGVAVELVPSVDDAIERYGLEPAVAPSQRSGATAGEG